MERSARVARPKTRAISNSVAAARSQADKLAALLVRLARPLAAFEKVGHSLESFEEKIAPAEKTAGKLDETLGKRLTIKIPLSKKTVSFSIRQILEKPGNVIGVVLKPLEKLADKLLQPVLKKLKLEIKAPSGLTELSGQVAFLSSIDAELSRADSELAGRLSSKLDQVFKSWQTIRPNFPRQSAPSAGRPNETKPRPIKVTPVAPPAKRTEAAMFLQF